MPAAPSFPDLTAEEHSAFEEGVRQFNAGHFFECHETLEDLWSGVRGPSRDFFQGIIQVAVAFYHLGNRNFVGAERLFDRALRRLEPYPDLYGGLDLGALRRTVRQWRDDLPGGSEDPDRAREAPRLRPASGASPAPGRGPGGA